MAKKAAAKKKAPAKTAVVEEAPVIEEAPVETVPVKVKRPTLSAATDPHGPAGGALGNRGIA